jgi:hypothetical protein
MFRRILPSLAPVLAGLLLTQHALAATANYSCVGTEPFWNFEWTGEETAPSALFIPSDGRSTLQIPVDSSEPLAGLPENFGIVLRGETPTCGQVTVVINQNEDCSTPGIDETYSHQILLLTTDGGNYFGCCRAI